MGLSGKTVYINKESKCYFKSPNSELEAFPELDSNHREADQKIPMHVFFLGQSSERTICVVADDSDIYMGLLFICHRTNSKLYFRQGKSSDKTGITYHDIRSVADKLGIEICLIILCFHALTGSDFTFPFYYRAKITVFRKMLKSKDSYKLLESMATCEPNIKDVTEFVLRIVYNRPLKEKTLGEARYNILKTKKKDSKGRTIYPSSKSLPPDQSSLKMKILRSTFIAHCMTHCLDSDYVPLDPSLYGWKLVDNVWDPVWYEGSALPDPSEVEESEIDSEIYIEAMTTEQDVTDNDEYADSSESEYAQSCSEADSESDDEY